MLNITATFVLFQIFIGMEHTIEFVQCDCESLAVTLIRAKFWTATPHSPRLVFPFSLLDWAESLLLECQVFLKDFCTALYFHCPYPSPKASINVHYIITGYECSNFFLQRRNVYRNLIDSFEEYR